MLYLWLATIFGYTSPDMALSGAALSNNFFKIGGFGNSFANFNRNMFGYISYIYLPLLLLPIYRLHDDTSYSFRKIQLTFAYLLLFIGILMLQSLIFDSGQFGNYLHSLLVPYIGLFGVAILTFIIISVALLLIVERTAAFLLHYLGGTLQMALQSLGIILKQAFNKIKVKYADLSLDYIQRAHRKMVNQELSERETTTKNKFVDDEPLIERPLDEYMASTQNGCITEETRTNVQISQKDISSDVKSNQTTMQSDIVQQDSKDSFNIQVRPHTSKTQSPLSYQQYNENDVNTISHTPRTEIRNNEEDLLRRFQKANPYSKQNQQPHTSYADEPMTFRLKPEDSESSPLESFAKTQQPKTLPTVDDWWLTDTPFQRETKTINLIKPKNQDSIKVSKKTAESFTVKEVTISNNVANPPKDFTLEISATEQDSKHKDSMIQVKQNPISKQIDDTLEIQNYEEINKQTQQTSIQNKTQAQQIPLHASYKTLDMSFTKQDSNQDMQYLEQKDSMLKDLIQPSSTQTTQNLTQHIYMEESIEQELQYIDNQTDTLEQVPKEVAIESIMPNNLKDTFVEEHYDNSMLATPLDSIDSVNNETLKNATESTTITIPSLHEETLNVENESSINNMPMDNKISDEMQLNRNIKQENNLDSKNPNIQNNLQEERNFDIIEITKEPISEVFPNKEEIITINPTNYIDDCPIHKQDSIYQSHTQNDQAQEMQIAEIDNNTHNTESKEAENIAQDIKTELQNNSKSILTQSNSQSSNSHSTQDFTPRLNTSVQQDSITNPYNTAINHIPHTIAQTGYTQPQISANLHYPTNMQAQSYDFNITPQHSKEYYNKGNTTTQQYSNIHDTIKIKEEVLPNSPYIKDSMQDVKISPKDSIQPRIIESRQQENMPKEQEKATQEITINESINPEDMIIRQIAQKKKEARQESNILLANHDTNIINSMQKEDLPPFILPPLKLLQEPIEQDSIQDIELDSKIEKMLQIFNAHKIRGDIIDTLTGPVVTTFEFRPETHVKVSKILSHRNDLARILKAKSIRIQAPIPGKDVIGIQIPNSKVETIFLREILQSEAFLQSKDMLTIALGKDISGMPIVANLAKLPHLLVAGTTGSGKSVGVNAIILSLLYRNDPDSLKLMMIDPKQVEFAPYEDLPHLITPIINAPNKAIKALQVATVEMDRRYELFSQIKVKNIASYNEKVSVKMPNFVIIIDELADLMITGGKEAEAFIARIAQMGRAAGMHLIIATQRSSVNVITGHIKANLPSRISYRVGSRIDSKVILDEMGAEDLLGNGDGLFTTTNGLMRIHAPWVSEQEVEHIVDFIKAQREPQYDDNFLSETKPGASSSDKFSGEGSLIDKAKEVILQDNKTSISYLQRKLGIGYNKSASLIEALEQEGFLSAPNSKGERSIL